MMRPRDVLTALFLTFWFLCLMQFASKAQTLREWFDSLKNQRGEVCCFNFDGQSVDDLGWKIERGKYHVWYNGAWNEIPDEAVVTVPNRLGRAHIWMRGDGSVRCFIPGPLS